MKKKLTMKDRGRRTLTQKTTMMTQLTMTHRTMIMMETEEKTCLPMMKCTEMTLEHCSSLKDGPWANVVAAVVELELAGQAP